MFKHLHMVIVSHEMTFHPQLPKSMINPTENDHLNLIRICSNSLKPAQFGSVVEVVGSLTSTRVMQNR